MFHLLKNFLIPLIFLLFVAIIIKQHITIKKILQEKQKLEQHNKNLDYQLNKIKGETYTLEIEINKLQKEINTLYTKIYYMQKQLDTIQILEHDKENLENYLFSLHSQLNKIVKSIKDKLPNK